MIKISWLAAMVLLLAGTGTAFALDINVLILKDLKKDGKYLKLNHSGMLYDAGVKQLAESKLLKKVETLDLNTHNIGDEGAEAIAQSKNLPNLKVLNLFNNQIEMVGAKSRGFVYYVSLTGVTGARDSIAKGVEEKVTQIKQATSLPVLVGFGISGAEQAKAASGFSDGVIVGSAIVRMIDETPEPAERKEKLKLFVRSMKQSLQDCK